MTTIEIEYLSSEDIALLVRQLCERIDGARADGYGHSEILPVEDYGRDMSIRRLCELKRAATREMNRR